MLFSNTCNILLIIGLSAFLEMIKFPHARAECSFRSLEIHHTKGITTFSVKFKTSSITCLTNTSFSMPCVALMSLPQFFCVGYSLFALRILVKYLQCAATLRRHRL